MPKKKKTEPDGLDALIDSLPAGMSHADIAAVAMQLKKRLIQRALGAELDDHLGYAKHASEGYDGGNSRNGSCAKTVKLESGEIRLEVPRDRDGSFEPQFVRKGQRRLKGFDDKIISLYARGLTTREIRGHLKEIYDVDVSPDLVSRVTDQVLAEVQQWQTRSLNRVYPFLYLDGFVVKVRVDGATRNRTVYIALAVNMHGKKEVLGLWMADTEGAKFWLSVINDLKTRGVEDVLIASVDGLKGFPEAIEAVFPRSVVQTCIVHMVRNSTHLVGWRHRKELAKDLRLIYRSPTEQAGLDALSALEEKWSAQYPSVAASWRANWTRVAAFFEFGPEIRKAIYTTNPIEALNRQLRKVTKTRGVFPTDNAVHKLLWLAIGKAEKKWTMPIRDWALALQQLAIHFPGRVPLEEYANR